MGLEGIYCLMLVIVLVTYGSIIVAFTFGLIKQFGQKNNPLFSLFRHFAISPSPPVMQSPCHPVTIILPVRNESGNITRILSELRNQDYPLNLMEIIVTDDFSDDDTMDLAGRFAKQFPEVPLVLLYPEKGNPEETGKKRAITRAVNLAKGDLLLCTDADTMHGPGWISSMVAGFVSEKIQMVLGPVTFTNERNLLQKIQSLEFMGLMGSTAGSAGLGYPVMCNGANLGYRRKAFVETGGFTGNLKYRSGDDQFLMSSIRRHYGSKAIVFNSNSRAVLSTEPESSLSGFLNQRIRWVSKSRGYRDPVVIAVGIVTWLVNFLLLTGIIVGFFFPAILLTSLVLWLIKILLEYPLVRIMIRFFGKKELYGYYFIAQVFQLVYVVLTGILGLFLPYRWKGRTSQR